MTTDVIGFIANLLSLVLWGPQARTTWKNRNNYPALEGISLVTQIIVLLNTSAWCLYGLLTGDKWLPLGTIIVAPLAIITIYLKLRANKHTKTTK